MARRRSNADSRSGERAALTCVQGRETRSLERCGGTFVHYTEISTARRYWADATGTLESLLSRGAVRAFDRDLDQRVRPAAARTAAAVARVVVGRHMNEVIAGRAEIDLRRRFSAVRLERLAA